MFAAVHDDECDTIYLTIFYYGRCARTVPGQIVLGAKTDDDDEFLFLQQCNKSALLSHNKLTYKTAGGGQNFSL